MKKIFKIFIVVIILLFVLSLAKNLIIKSVVSAVATQVTGAKVEISGFSLGILQQSVHIRDFKMYNPVGFPEGILVDLAKIEVNYDLAALLKGKLHLKLADVDLKEIGLERNKENKLNVDALKVAQKPQEPESKEAKKPTQQIPMQIDELNLKMDRVVYKDYSKGQEPIVRVYDINLKKTYKNITSAEHLVALILVEPMKHAGIKGAMIYGAVALTGIGIIPVAIATTFTQKDNAMQEFDIPLDRVYNISLEVLKQAGKIKKEDKNSALIEADVDNANVILKLEAISAKATQVTVSARRFGFPKPEVAGGVLYQIAEKLGKK